MELISEFKEQYPFRSHYQLLGEHKLHYIDEGQGDPIVMVHGNPTWSFYYRNLIKELSKTNRVIAIDHMGCGLSDKPQDYQYTLKQRVSDLTSLLEQLNILKYSMIVHDWGGAIGFGHAIDHVERIDKMIILNTAAFLSSRIPFTIGLCKLKFVGPFMVKYLNSFCYPATFMTTEKKLSNLVKKAYLFPYQGVQNRVAISEFVQDIPMAPTHRSYDYLRNIEEKLPLLKGKKLILWGGKDFCFNDDFFHKWQQIYPDADYKYYENAGHYVLEDEKEDTLKTIKLFLGNKL